MTDITDWDDDILGEGATDDGIIELTDIVKEDSNLSTQEDVIELTDIVEEKTTNLDLDIVKEVGFEVDETPEQEEDISFEEIPFDEVTEMEDETSFEEGLELEIDDSTDDDSPEPEELTVPSGDLSVSQEQVEAVLERIIEKKFAGKIETILFEVMERVIQKEIIEIKKSLQEDLNQIGNA